MFAISTDVQSFCLLLSAFFVCTTDKFTFGPMGRILISFPSLSIRSARAILHIWPLAIVQIVSVQIQNLIVIRRFQSSFDFCKTKNTNNHRQTGQTVGSKRLNQFSISGFESIKIRILMESFEIDHTWLTFLSTENG